MNIAITGANGFVGRHLCRHFTDAGHRVTAITRGGHSLGTQAHHVLPDLSNTIALIRALEGVDVVIHLAGIAHTHNVREADYYTVNVDYTAAVAEAAIAAHVKQCIYFSSIKVNGEFTDSKPFSCNDKPNPQDHYASSKWQAEQRLAEICTHSSLSLLIIRPPLIYGNTPKGNLQSLTTALKYRIPLPLKGLNNKRDLVSLGNLSLLLEHCLLKPSLHYKTLLVSDGKPVSTTDLVHTLGEAIGASPILISCPPCLQKLLQQLPLVSGIFRRLYQNMEIDISDTITATGWRPVQPNSHPVKTNFTPNS